MSELKHYNGLSQEIDKQASDNLKSGGPSEEFKREARKHGIIKPYKDVKRTDGFLYNDGIGLVICKKCGKKARGHWHEKICLECYED